MLPRDVQEALDKYERDKANGTLVFTHDGEFAAMPPDYIGGWIQGFMAGHLPDMDTHPLPNEHIDYGRCMRQDGPVPLRQDGTKAGTG